MNGLTFKTAYEQLTDLQRDFVDGFVRFIEARNEEQPFERLTTTLVRAAANYNVANTDNHSRDMFQNPIVAAAIRERIETIATERDLSPARIMREHSILALSNMQDYVVIEDGGQWGHVKADLTREQMAAVQQLEFEETYSKNGIKRVIKLKLYNKQQSLGELSKFMGMNKEDSEEYARYMNAPHTSGTITEATPLAEISEEYARLIE